jgi:hypothetical protein
MPRQTLSYDYDLHIVTTTSARKRSAKILDEKIRVLEPQCRTKVEANSLFHQSTYVLYRDPDLLQEGHYKQGVLDSDFFAHWGDLMTLSQFVDEFCHNEDPRALQIHIDKNDIESFRIASFIVSFCIRSKRYAEIRSYDDDQVLTMYEPPINESSQLVLFSIISLTLKQGDPPRFEQLREHHFASLEGSGKWTSANDNKYVASLYASLRTLARLGLIEKKFHEKERLMTGITPTANGYYSVLFSGLSKKFEVSLADEDLSGPQDVGATDMDWYDVRYEDTE